MALGRGRVFEIVRLRMPVGRDVAGLEVLGPARPGSPVDFDRIATEAW